MAVRPPGIEPPPRAMASKPLAALADDIQYVRGVGPAVAQMLHKVGVRTVGDLLRHAPRRYEDRRSFRRISELRPGEWAAISGRVVAADNVSTSRRGLSLTKVLVDDGSGVAQLTFFQQPYLLKQFQQLARAGARIVVFAQAKASGWGPVELERAEWEELDPERDSLSANRIVPIYPSTEGLTQKRLRRIAATVLETHLQHLPEILPDEVRKARGLMDPQTAYRQIHFPDSLESAAAARRRLVFEEFFLLQVTLARRRYAHHTAEEGFRFRADIAALEEDLHAILPFALTRDQRRAIEEICADVTGGRAMNRLIQGDVGSGKTVVALAAMLLAVRNGFQAALMAPTEILAQQHAIVFRRLLEPLGILVELATGSKSAKAKASARSALAGGMASIAVGTHALIQEGMEFHNLGLVVIDEQHRFGVLQRQALHRKGERPHVLVMTATPIPRTLSMTVYGDLDTSVIKELPPGRKPIKTHWKRRSEAPSVYGAMQRLLREGRQAYIVCPLVEESEKLQVRAATRLAEQVREELLPGFRVGLLHGQLKADEKDEVMRQFKAGELDALVATTVIEVGIDVPNASIMVIEDAERFGLAQLHQLRGRVGRGEQASYCILISDARTEDARARMEIMVETQDGFRIAEEDMNMRGPGELLGTRQSGLPEFAFGSLVQDADIMAEARAAAGKLVEADPNLRRPENAALRQALESSRHGFDLVNVS